MRAVLAPFVLAALFAGPTLAAPPGGQGGNTALLPAVQMPPGSPDMRGDTELLPAVEPPDPGSAVGKNKLLPAVQKQGQGMGNPPDPVFGGSNLPAVQSPGIGSAGGLQGASGGMGGAGGAGGWVDRWSWWQWWCRRHDETLKFPAPRGAGAFPR